MKISQEVREFAAKQNSDSYLAAENLKGENTPAERDANEEGTDKLSKLYKEKGEHLYLPAED